MSLLIGGCTLNKGLSLTSDYARASTAWHSVSQPKLINKLKQEDQPSAKREVENINKVLTFIHTFSESDASGKKKLVSKLPLQVVRSRASFSRLTTLVTRNQERFTVNELTQLKKIKTDLDTLYTHWDSIAGDSEKLSQLLAIIETVELLKGLK